jgi:ribosomal RNA-processing protein 8
MTKVVASAAAEGSLSVAGESGVRKPERKLSALQEKLRKRLDSGSFRQLNEQLYSCTGAQAVRLMKADPALFSTYHAGYADQVRRWPRNPLDAVLAFLRTQPNELVVADLGCGEARLAADAAQRDVRSFDLVAANKRVIACDIAHVPLPDSSVDVAVFCLSLMGTNYGEFLAEARRIVVPGGWVLVAEVTSRFENQNPTAFKRAVADIGFRIDDGHEFVKLTRSADGSARGPGSSRVGPSPKQTFPGTKKGIKGRRQARRQDTLAASSAMTDAPFFLSFAFQSTKAKAGTSRAKKMPTLKACVYKKR